MSILVKKITNGFLLKIFIVIKIINGKTLSNVMQNNQVFGKAFGKMPLFLLMIILKPVLIFLN